VADDYQHWRDCLTGRTSAGPDPACGFWRAKTGRRGLFQVIAIFKRNGETVCVVGEQEVPLHVGWTMFAEAITEDAYRRARDGEPFADEFAPNAGYAGPSPLVTDLRDAQAIRPPVGKKHGAIDSNRSE